MSALELQFDYHQILHDSQTLCALSVTSRSFDYHQILHDSQTTAIAYALSLSLTTIRYYTTLKPQIELVSLQFRFPTI